MEGLGGEQGHAVPAGRGCPAGAPSPLPGGHQGGHGGAALAARGAAPLRLARGDPRLLLAARRRRLLLLQGPIGRARGPAAAVLAVGLRLGRRELLRGRVLARPCSTATTAATVDGRDGPRLDLAAAFRPGLLELYVAAEPLEGHLARDVVDHQDALAIVRPLRALEHRVRRARVLGQRVLDVRNGDGDLVLLADFDVRRLGRVYRGRLEVVFSCVSAGEAFPMKSTEPAILLFQALLCIASTAVKASNTGLVVPP